MAKIRLLVTALISVAALLFVASIVVSAQGIPIGGCTGCYVQTTNTSGDWIPDPLEIITSTTTPNACKGYLITDITTLVNGWISYPGNCLNGTGDGIAIKSAPGNSIVSGYYVSNIRISVTSTFTGQSVYVTTSAGTYSTSGTGIASLGVAGLGVASTDSYINVPIGAIINNDINIFWNLGDGNTCGWSGIPVFWGSSGVDPGVLYTDCPRIDAIYVDYIVFTPTPVPPTNTLAASWTAIPTGTDGPTFTPGPGVTTTAGLTVTPMPTLNLSTRSSSALITPTDYPCNADNYVFQNGNNNLGTPCGNLILFATIALPTMNLPSPTLYIIKSTPTPIPVTPTPSTTPSPTVTPSITPTPGATTPSGGGIGPPPTAFSFDTGGIAQMGTSVAAQFATLVPLGQISVPVNGTQVGVVDSAHGAANGIGAVIVFARSLAATGFDAGGMINAGLLLLIFVVAVQLFVVIFPIVFWILKWVVYIIQVILTPF